MFDLRSFRTVILLQNISIAYNIYIADEILDFLRRLVCAQTSQCQKLVGQLLRLQGQDEVRSNYVLNE